MFQLNYQDVAALRSQIVTLKEGKGQHRKYSAYVFTEQGVAMLSSVLNSERAIEVNVAMMRLFVKLREMIITHKDLAKRLVFFAISLRIFLNFIVRVWVDFYLPL